MTAGTEAAAKDLNVRLQACLDRLDDAIARARAGEIAPMTGMEAEMDALSASILAAPVAVGHDVQPLVAGVVARLDMLESELRGLRDRALQQATEE